jgi:pimeloyl-ACP methyl ester carboxylesterase
MDAATSADGTRIAYERFGDGPAVILVDGAFQHRAIDPGTTRLAELVAAKGFTVLHHDRRGRQNSGDTPPYAVEREIEDVDAVIDAAGGSAAVFGMSSGATLALEAAARGSAITKLALYEPPMIVDDTRAPIPPDYLERLKSLAASGRRDEAVELFLTEGVGVSADTVAGMRGAPVWQGFASVAHTLPYDATIVDDTVHGRRLPTDRWSTVRMPTIVIDGGASPAWARNAVAALVDVLASARRVTLEGQTHQYDPEILAPALSEFFA